MSTISLFLRKILSVGFLLFILGFFLSTTPGKHNHIYINFVIIPFILILLTNYAAIAKYTNDKLFIFTEIVLCYLAITIFWGGEFTFIDFVNEIKKLLSITILLLSVKLVINTNNVNQKKIIYIISLTACIIACLVLIKFIPTYTQKHYRFAPKLGSILTLGRYNNCIRVAWIWGATALFTIWIFYSKAKANPLWLFLVLPPQLILLTITFSRGPILAFFLGLTIIMYCNRHALLEKRNLIAVLCFIALIIACLVATGLGGKIYFGLTRGKKDFSFEEAQGFSYRFPIWQESIKQTSNNMFWGQGFSKEEKIVITTNKKLSFSHSHNFIIDVYRFGGLVGVALVSFYLAYCLYVSFRTLPHENKIWGIILFYGILCLLTNGKYILNNLSEFWFIFWLPISFIYALRNIEPIGKGESVFSQ